MLKKEARRLRVPLAVMVAVVIIMGMLPLNIFASADQPDDLTDGTVGGPTAGLDGEKMDESAEKPDERSVEPKDEEESAKQDDPQDDSQDDPQDDSQNDPQDDSQDDPLDDPEVLAAIAALGEFFSSFSEGSSSVELTVSSQRWRDAIAGNGSNSGFSFTLRNEDTKELKHKKALHSNGGAIRWDGLEAGTYTLYTALTTRDYYEAGSYFIIGDDHWVENGKGEYNYYEEIIVDGTDTVDSGAVNLGEVEFCITKLEISTQLVVSETQSCAYVKVFDGDGKEVVFSWANYTESKDSGATPVWFYTTRTPVGNIRTDLEFDPDNSDPQSILVYGLPYDEVYTVIYYGPDDEVLNGKIVEYDHEEDDWTADLDVDDDSGDSAELVWITGGTEITQPSGKLQLTAHVWPSGASQSVEWSISDESIASIVGNGLNAEITAVRDGKVTVRATSTDNPDIFRDFEIEVSEQPTRVDTIEISVVGGADKVAVGGELQVQADIQPADADNKTVEWSFAGDGEAEIKSVADPDTGEITYILTAKKSGTVTVTAVINDGGSVVKSAGMQITINIPLSSITGIIGENDKTDVNLGETLPMNIQPNEPTGLTIEWSVKNGTGEATIHKDTGILTPIKGGTVTVVATIADGNGGETEVEREITIVIPLEAITISGVGGASAVNVGEKLQMRTLPAEASGLTVKWTVTDGTGKATIDENTGVLTGVSGGTVIVTAEITDGNEVRFVQKEITVNVITSHTITFNSNSGTPASYTIKTNANGTLPSLPTPTRDGHDFLGWYTAVVGGNQVTTSMTFASDTTVFAHWAVSRNSSSNNSSSSSNNSSSSSSSGGGGGGGGSGGGGSGSGIDYTALSSPLSPTPIVLNPSAAAIAATGEIPVTPPIRTLAEMDIPQTGGIPAEILAVAGLVIIIVGVLLMRKKRDRQM